MVGVILNLSKNTVHAVTPLGGVVEQTVLTSSENPYVIDQDIVIPDGKKLTIKEGCVLLFKPFTGIVVQGMLAVEGTPAQPVVLTSYNDNKYNEKNDMLPNPFDWNGILIHPLAHGAVIRNCVVSFSVYGVKSQTARLDIESGTFRQNGQFNCTVNDKILPAVDNVQFTWKPEGEDLAVIMTSDSTKAKKKERVHTTRRGVRFAGLGLGVLGVGVGTVFLIEDIKSQRIIRKYEEAQRSGQDPPPGSSLDDAAKAYDAYPMQEAVAIASYVLAGIGIAGFTLTFVF